jgi:hypothetical protein
MRKQAEGSKGKDRMWRDTKCTAKPLRMYTYEPTPILVVGVLNSIRACLGISGTKGIKGIGVEKFPL